MLLFVGLDLGILGVIFAASSSELSKVGVSSLFLALLLWVFGFVAILVSKSEDASLA